MTIEGVYSVQEPHFWTLCSDVYIGMLKLEVSPKCDPKYVTSTAHNIFAQVRNILFMEALKASGSFFLGWCPAGLHPLGFRRHLTTARRLTTAFQICGTQSCLFAFRFQNPSISVSARARLGFGSLEATNWHRCNWGYRLGDSATEPYGATVMFRYLVIHLVHTLSVHLLE